MHHGQAANEFLIVFTAFLVLYIIFTFIYSNQSLNLLQSTDNLDALKVTYKLSNAINHVYLAGDGASMNVTVVNSRLAVTIVNGILSSSVPATNALSQAKLLTRRVNATNVSLNREMIIKNKGGSIEIG